MNIVSMITMNYIIEVVVRRLFHCHPELFEEPRTG